MMIRNAASLRDRLTWALALDDLADEQPSNVRDVVLAELLPAMNEYDPLKLMEIGMRAVIRDIQEWLEANTDNRDAVDAKGLSAYLLAALITANGYEDPAGAADVIADVAAQ